ncbi:hypothetical protein V6N13_064570 [Hibiscus sabdariffa]|uniref:RNase H type-1 domain-containing protein n=1 Tax=Hibiscus sabdariffa TaxID=183260 RepID=A0ABR2EAG7_9ROSI
MFMGVEQLAGRTKIANSTSSRISQPSNTWSPPPPNTFKINCDVSFNKDMNFVGVAVVARNCHGDVFDGINAKVHASSAFVAECLTMRIGSYLIARHGWQYVIIESDCKLSIEMINRQTPDSWEGKGIFSYIRKITEFVANFDFACFNFLSNQVAA